MTLANPLTEEEKKAFLKNEERLWDLAAITVASSLTNHFWLPEKIADLAFRSYEIADALIAERRRKLLTEPASDL